MFQSRVRVIALVLPVCAFACSSTSASPTPGGGGGGGLSGTIYWIQSVEIEVHKLDLATGTDKTLGFGHKVSRASDGKLVIVGKQGLEESTEELVSTRTIKKTDNSGKDDSSVNFNDVAVSPDGASVAYDTLSDNTYVCDRASGAVTAKITAPGATDAYLRPSWTPDGRLVVGGGFANPGIFVSDAGLGKMTRIDPDLDQPRQPAVSPDGTKVAFILKKLVYVVGIDGSGLAQIDTDDDQDDKWPTWSPDGKYIAYYAKAGHMKVRPAAGGEAIDVLETFPALADKIIVFGTSAPFQWVE